MQVTGYDHVNLVMPAGGEDEARAFYEGILGLPAKPKPASLQARAVLWFGNDSVTVHIGVEEGFRPARQAHPAFRIDGLAELRARCEAAGYATSEDQPIPGYDRFFVNDPFGNRIELMELQKK